MLGLGKEIFSMNGACLMGETSGYFADPKGAREIVRVLKGILGLDLDLTELEERSKQIEQITGRMQEDLQNKASKKEDLGYFG